MRQWAFVGIGILWQAGIIHAQGDLPSLQQYVDKDLRKLDRRADYELSQLLDRSLPREFQSSAQWTDLRPWFLWQTDPDKTESRFLLVQVAQPLTTRSNGIYALHLLDGDGRCVSSLHGPIGRKQRVGSVSYAKSEFERSGIIEIRLASANGGQMYRTYGLKDGKLSVVFNLSLALRDPSHWTEILVHGNKELQLEALNWLADRFQANSGLDLADRADRDPACKLAVTVWKQSKVRGAVKKLRDSDDQSTSNAAKRVIAFAEKANEK